MDTSLSKAHFRGMFEQSPIACQIMAPDGSIMYVNRAFQKLWGISDETVTNQLLSTYNLLTDIQFASLGLLPYLQRALAGESVDLPLARYVPHDTNIPGRPRWVRAYAYPVKNAGGQVEEVILLLEDVTDQLLLEESLRRKAAMDDLTGLPNRATARECLTHAISEAEDTGLYAVLMIVDLDNFKYINDGFGHHVGDYLLKQCAKRLRNAIHEDFTVARFGGDEFLIVMPLVDKMELAESVASRVVEAFEKPFFLERNDVFITASIGITVYPTDSCDADSLLRYADTAMYRAKNAGRNTYCFFMQKMNKQIQDRVELETELRYALERHELVVLYQPIIDSHTGELFAVEALIRWHNAKLGMIPPDQFIPLAEELGLITPIGDWLLQTTCKDVQQWMEQTGRTLILAVNVSSRQFIGESMTDSVKSALASSRLPPQCLDIELTERLLVSEEAGKTLHLLREAGIHISIDDFGTGYSSLNYLTTLPISFLKVDRSFIQNVPDHAKRSTLVRSVIELSHSLELKVIGEGVETVEQLHFLQQAGCDYVQGYYISPAQPIELLRSWRAASRNV